MVYHTQFSPRSPIIEYVKKQWNPSETLEIINPYNDCLTCVGYAPSQGRRCRNPIRADNRALIKRTLDEIAYLPPDSSAVMSRLRAIAGPALCVRFHQGQADTVVMQWQRKIQLLKPQVREQKPAKPVQSSRRQASVRDRRVEDLQDQLRKMEEAMAKLREEIDSQQQQGQESEGSEERAVKDRQEERRQRKSAEREGEARRKERERERLEKERVEKERLEKERLEKERLENERLENERLEKERLEKERVEKERLEKERLEKERLEKERLAKEKREKEEKQQREREAAAANERIRQRAQKLREEREREKREKEQKEREEWDQLWAKYQERWTQFKASASDARGENIRDAIPWPVKSGLYCDVKASNVKEFFQKAVSRDKDMVKLIRKECLKWHPDSRRTWLRDARLGDVDNIMVDMICRVVTELLNGSAGRSSEFLG